MQLRFSICSWGAWSPQHQQPQDWQHWRSTNTHQNSSLADTPKLARVPAMQRRRYSALTKMQLEAAFQADAPHSCRTIFASRHGELHRTIGLLNNIVKAEPLSPLAFSQSVHNTASGIYSILTDNRAPSTSIAAGEESLPQALIEAYAQLNEDPTPVLLVFGDQPVPEIYTDFVDELDLPLSLALVIERCDESSTKPQLTLSQAREGNNISYGELVHSLSVARPIAGNLCHYHWELSFD
ncbi:Beta-ketoacyl synthase, N-terminal domain [Shewanella psychrophila]|uniref:Beta-ketoacyl synthase, N-terminal domain n=1 Tax=Shewanella psychrophila TaxID=225848 RepID=A0A1S6HSK4_9GAMM|nr:beta-ketoacyl synthase chain length factor [Shewanella psychrophila]AQS38464.1 Beta-ketoacyl synthase, N-terminal domain [Shewanella psychrophila]